MNWLRWLIFVYLISAVIVFILLARASRRKKSSKDGLTILQYGIELADELEESIAINIKDPRIRLISRDDEAEKKKRYSIYIGLADSGSSLLAVPEGVNSFYGYSILSMELDFRGNEKIQVCFDEISTARKKFPMKIQAYGIDDNSKKMMFRDVLSWVKRADIEFAEKHVS